MMINHNLFGFRCFYRCCQRFNTFQTVEVETAYQLCFFNNFVSKGSVSIIDKYVFTARQPFEEGGEYIGHDDKSLLPHRTKKVCQSERRTDSVAVGRNMCYDNYLMSLHQCKAQFGKCILVDYFSDHLSSLIFEFSKFALNNQFFLFRAFYSSYYLSFDIETLTDSNDFIGQCRW